MTYEPVAYADTYNGAMLCPEHGDELTARLVTDHEPGTVDELTPTPIFEWDEPLDVLQSCDHGHAFCGNCGSDWIEVHTERSTSRTWRCDNCGAQARFLVDGRVFNKWAFGDGRWHKVDNGY